MSSAEIKEIEVKIGGNIEITDEVKLLENSS